jgi:hypothetical protein
MGDIQIGDKVCTPDGKYANVIAVHPQGLKDLYRITFQDGDTIDCCKDHLWKIYNNKTESVYILDTQTLIENPILGYNKRALRSIELTNPVLFAKQEIDLDPYLLGLLIGDGCLRNSVSITSIDNFIIDYVRNSLDSRYELTNNPKKISYFIVKKIKNCFPNIYIEKLKKIGLFNKKSHTKFIPKEYIYNSFEIRLAILQGLMDSDGTVCKDKNGSTAISYSTTSKQLSEDVAEIAKSLGMRCKIAEHYTHYCKNGKNFKSYRVSIKSNNDIPLFRLPRKLNRIKVRRKPPLRHSIIKIEPIGKKEAQCITIDSKDGLYLTTNYIVTHNSFISINAGLHISGRLQIPVLYIDTEMDREQQWCRILPNIIARVNSKDDWITIDELETGQFSKSSHKKDIVNTAKDKLKKTKFSYQNVSGITPESVFSIIRRWVYKNVGFDENGRTKDCVVIYDYVKLVDEAEIKVSMSEFQRIGFIMTGLHNLSVKLDIPILGFTQLNRDGVDKESVTSVAQSDRIIWFCSNFSIWKDKSDEEIANDGYYNGNKKMVPLISRFGAGLQSGDYINYKFEGKYGRIVELDTKFNTLKKISTEKQGGLLTLEEGESLDLSQQQQEQQEQGEDIPVTESSDETSQQVDGPIGD